MFKVKLNIFFILAVFCICCYGDEFDVYKTILDIKNPTFADLEKVQNYLTNGDRKEIDSLQTSNNPMDKFWRIDLRMRNMKIIPQAPDQTITESKYIYNTDDSDRERCIICYSSFNYKYPEGIKRIDKFLKRIGYKGHFIAKIGGWPNIQGGDLVFAHIPYAFKLCFFEEVKNLGYKNVLWIDSSIIPLKSLEPVFEKIEKVGYFGYLSSHKVVDYSNEEALATFGLDMKKAEDILTIEGSVIGLNLKTEVGNLLLNEWRKSALNGGFYSARSDQNSFSIIAYLNNLKDWDNPSVHRPFQLQDITENAIFCLDHSFTDLP